MFLIPVAKREGLKKQQLYEQPKHEYLVNGSELEALGMEKTYRKNHNYSASVLYPVFQTACRLL